MVFWEDDIDITKNIQIIEWLKAELVSAVANVYNCMIKKAGDSRDAIADCLANVILVCYLLARRLGISYVLIDQKINQKINMGIKEQSDIESRYGDLSYTRKYLNRNK